MTKTKISLGVIAVTVLTVATLFLLPLPQKTTVETVVAERGMIADTLLLEGVVGYGDEEMLLCLQSGTVKRVYVAPGEKVQRGQLLFLMDTGGEELAMAALAAEMDRLEEMEKTGEPLGELFSLRRAELLARQAELSGSIDAKQIRAVRDGVVGLVCCREGDAVMQGTVMGSIHGEDMGVSAYVTTDAARQLAVGTAAFLLNEEGERIGSATLEHVGPPIRGETTGSTAHPLWFSADCPKTPGRRLTLEVVRTLWENEVLVPLEAVSADNEVWMVENGRVETVRINTEKQSGSFAAGPETLDGKTLILLPDESGLKPGEKVAGR